MFLLLIEVLGHVCREIRVHPHDLNFAEFDTLGTFLMVGSSEHGKIFLCDTKTSSTLKLSPVPQRGGLSGRGRKQKFKPSFDSPTSRKKPEEEAPKGKAMYRFKIPPQDGSYLKVS